MIFNLFSIKKDINVKSEEKEKFELVSCPLNQTYCKKILPAINEDYAESENFLRSKNFDNSINALEKAYNKTMELPESPCSKCSAFLRSTISDSVENIHCELKSMSKGLFSTNRYQSSCEKAEQVLDKFHNDVNKEQFKEAV